MFKNHPELKPKTVAQAIVLPAALAYGTVKGVILGIKQVIQTNK